MFNEDYKNSFINTFEKDDIRRHQALGFFRKTKSAESSANKDLFDMTYSELDSVLRGIAFKNSNSAMRDISVLNSYISWATTEGHSSNQSYRMFSLAYDEVSKYVYSKLNTIYTFDELKEEWDKNNEQYALITWLTFEGFGHNEFEEIQTLKVDSLSELDGKYYITVDRGVFEIPKELHDRLLDFDDVLNDYKMADSFKNTPFIFKPFDRKSKFQEIVIKPTVRHRIWLTYKESLQDDTFDSRTLKRSGINYYVYKMMQDSGEMLVTMDILKRVADRFNFAKMRNTYLHKKIIEQVDFDFIRDEYGDFEIDEYVKKKM